MTKLCVPQGPNAVANVDKMPSIRIIYVATPRASTVGAKRVSPPIENRIN